MTAYIKINIDDANIKELKIGEKKLSLLVWAWLNFQKPFGLIFS